MRNVVSMKDIARECGVSVATVSKSLNGHSDIGEETRERIRLKAKEMGYLANSAARALKTKRTHNIGVLFVDERNSGLAHDYFSAVLDSLRVEAEQSSYDITFISSKVGTRRATYLDHCRYRGVDGVVIACVDFKDPMVQELADSEIPVVTIDHVFNNRTAVISDNARGTAELVRYAAARGHRRIGFIHGDRTAVTENRLVGFYRACEEAGLDIPDEYVRQAAYHDPDGCWRVTNEMLDLTERPTCILFPDDFSYIGGVNAIQKRHLRIPEDISAIGYDGIRLSQVVSPRLTTWQQDTKSLGQTAAARLIQLIENPRTTLPEVVTIPGQLLEGASVKTLRP